MLASLLVLLATVDAPRPAEVPPGTRIVAVRIVRHDVFDLEDPATSAWPYRAADALHVLSHEAFIRALLLFRVGDPLDPAKLAESERILRGTGFLNPVNITAHPASGGAEVVVETHDQWTTEFSINYGRFGAKQHSGASLSEKNFLGWGKGVQVEYDSTPERTSTLFEYKDPLVFDTRWQLLASHRKSSDGSTDTFQLDYPFFSLATQLAGGGSWQRQGISDYLWAGGHERVVGHAATRTFELWGGLRLPGDDVVTNRLIVGAFGDRARFSNWRYLNGSPFSQPADRDLLGVEAGWDHETDSWKVVQGFRSWQRQEDVPLGPNWQVTGGLSLPAFGGDRARLRFDGTLTLGRLDGERYSWLLGEVSGRVERNGVANGITHVELGTAECGPAGWRVRAAADLGHDLDGEQQLPLGADTGLRGYDPFTFDGTSRVVANLEWRHRIDGEVLHVAALGITGFADAGRTWGARVGPSTEGWRSDVGVGLLTEITRTSVLHIIRLEVGFPDRGGKPVFLITGDSLF